MCTRLVQKERIADSFSGISQAAVGNNAVRNLHILTEMAQILLHKHIQYSTATVGVNWAFFFIRCCSELWTRYNQRITYQHAKQEDPNVLNQWFETVHAAIQEHGIHEDDIWNFDETGFAMVLCTTSKVITAVERSERPRTVIQGNREWVTIIECINLKGIPIPPVVILKGKGHQAPWYQEPLHPVWKLTNSINGWTTDEIGLKWLKQVFDPFSKSYSIGTKQLLILDSHSSRQTAEFDDFCKENAIICLCMPSHTSHLL